MDPLTATLGATVGKAALGKVSGHFIGKFLRREGSTEHLAVQLALQGLPQKRQAIARPALARWQKSSDGLSLQNSLNRGLRVTEAMLSRMERYLREDGGLEDQDQPRMVAKRYLTVLAKVQVSNGGVSRVIEQGERKCRDDRVADRRPWSAVRRQGSSFILTPSPVRPDPLTYWH